MSMEAYMIPQYLDEPERIAFWTIDEALALFIPALGGLFLGSLVSGLVFSYAAWWLLKKFKGSGNRNIARYALYWFFPNLFGFRVTPPSACRRFV